MSALPTLSEKMRVLAKTHPRSAELIAKADELDAKTAGHYASPQTVPTKSFLGAWARARRLWCELTGEALI